jgi:predicted P-loop ATPase
MSIADLSPEGEAISIDSPANLRPEHEAHLRSEGFCDDHINKMMSWGVRSLTTEAAYDSGFKCKDEAAQTETVRSSSGILFPFTHEFGQLRCDNPPTRRGKPAKYLTQTGKDSQAWMPPGQAVKVITEGFKDAAAGTLNGGIPTGALAGVSHYRKALPKGCGHTTLFDYDGWTNPSVFASLVSAADWCNGTIQLVPEIEGEPKAGLCEYFKAGRTAEDYKKLINSAMSIRQFLLELPRRWGKLPSDKFGQALRTVFALAIKHLDNAALGQLAKLCKTAGKAHDVPAHVIDDEYKRAKRLIAASKRKERLEKRAKLRSETPELDLTLVDDDAGAGILQTLVAVRNAVGDDLRLNKLTKQIEYKGSMVNPNYYKLFAANLIDADVTDSDSSQVLSVLAAKNAYHPAHEYFEGLSRKYGDTTTSLLDDASTRLLGTSDPLYDVFLRKTLAAMVQRVYDPGCKWDYILLLQGGQGLRKSTFLKTLLPNPKWFDDNLSSEVENKDQLALLNRCVLMEWAEFDRITSARESAALKSFVTRTTDTFRAPYDRTAIDHPRQSIITGSVNKAEFLNDATGDRRYWVIEVESKIDLAKVEAEREQLLAAAVAAYKAGELLYLSDEDEALSTENNAKYRMVDPWQNTVESYLADKANLMARGISEMTDWITAANIMTHCLSIEPRNQKGYDRTRVENILKTLGWTRESKQVRLQGCKTPQRAWYKAVDVPAVVPTAEPEFDPIPDLNNDIVASEPAQRQLLPTGEWGEDDSTIQPVSDPDQVSDFVAKAEIAISANHLELVWRSMRQSPDDLRQQIWEGLTVPSKKALERFSREVSA